MFASLHHSLFYPCSGGLEHFPFPQQVVAEGVSGGFLCFPVDASLFSLFTYGFLCSFLHGSRRSFLPAFSPPLHLFFFSVYTPFF